MFEKAAKEHAEKILKGLHVMNGREWAIHDVTFKDGVEFGYNKANSWHYPSKGDLPKVGAWVVGFFYGESNWHKMYFRADGRWWGGTLCQPPYAWKEIVLPKLKEGGTDDI